MLSGLDFEDSEQSTVHAYSEAAGSDDTRPSQRRLRQPSD